VTTGRHSMIINAYRFSRSPAAYITESNLNISFNLPRDREFQVSLQSAQTRSPHQGSGECIYTSTTNMQNIDLCTILHVLNGFAYFLTFVLHILHIILHILWHILHIHVKYAEYGLVTTAPLA
jgi:hypothetical protein